jgi:glucose-1-phosphatase
LYLKLYLTWKYGCKFTLLQSNLKPVSNIFFMPGIQVAQIRNIIFDLGGVLLNINPLLSLLEFANISKTDSEVLKNRLASERVFEKFDTGALSPDGFRAELCRIMAYKASNAEIDAAWNILLLDFPAERVELLKELRNNYRIFLLSNTNIIHFWKYTGDFYSTYGLPMAELFEKLFLSYEIGIHKPDAGIYTHVLQNAGLKAEECVFIDDSLANVDAARIIGMKGIHIANGRDVTQYFDNGILKSL